MKATMTQAGGTLGAATPDRHIQARDLGTICRGARWAHCPRCTVAPGSPCAPPDGLHLARFAFALGQRLITMDDFAAVLAMPGAAFTADTLINGSPSGGAR